MAKSNNFSVSLHDCLPVFYGFPIGIYSIIYKYILHVSKVRIEQQAVSPAGDASWSAYGNRAVRQVIFHIPFSSTLVKLLFQLLFLSSAYCESVILDWKILMLGLNLMFIIQLFIFMLLLGFPDVLMKLHKCCVSWLPKKKNYICVNFLWICKGSAGLSLVSFTL